MALGRVGSNLTSLLEGFSKTPAFLGGINRLNYNSNLHAHVPAINYTGQDCIATFRVGGIVFKPVDITTFSLSSFRSKTPAKKLGQSTPAGFGRGTRTVAGTIILTAGADHPLLQMLQTQPGGEVDGGHFRQILPDMLPPMDINLIFASEYYHPTTSITDVVQSVNSSANGFKELDNAIYDNFLDSTSSMDVYGVELLSDSIVVSVDDRVSEVVINYTAIAYTPLRRTRLALNKPLVNPFKDAGMDLLGKATEYLSLEEKRREQSILLANEKIEAGVQREMERRREYAEILLLSEEEQELWKSVSKGWWSDITSLIPDLGWLPFGIGSHMDTLRSGLVSIAGEAIDGFIDTVNMPFLTSALGGFTGYHLRNWDLQPGKVGFSTRETSPNEAFQNAMDIYRARAGISPILISNLESFSALTDESLNSVMGLDGTT